MTPTAVPAPRNAPLDAVRGLAATAVMLFHFGGFFALAGISDPSPAARGLVAVSRHGYLGVQVFFVLSGFVIAMTGPADGHGVWRFLARRLARIAPPYWASVLLAAGLWAVGRMAGYGQRDGELTAGLVASHLTYLQRAFGYPQLQEVYWTLCLEVQFYLLFVALQLVRRAGGRVVAGAAAAGLYVGCLGFGFAGHDTLDWFAGHWHGFALGMAAERAVATRRVWPLVAMAAAAVSLGWYRGRPEEFVLAAAAVGLCGLAVGGRASRPLLWLGRVSYSLYLLHSFVGGVVFYRLWPRLSGTEGGVWLILGLSAAASLGAAELMFRWVERPAVRWSKALKRG